MIFRKENYKRIVLYRTHVCVEVHINFFSLLHCKMFGKKRLHQKQNLGIIAQLHTYHSGYTN